MKHYLLKSVTPCPECNGNGIVAHPAWREYWQWNDHYRSANYGRQPSEDVVRFWWVENGFEHLSRHDLPPAEIDCYTCHGTGKIEEDIDLKSALTDLGINITYSNLQP